jgi:predicted DNA-binding transcriptional regulator YafY
MSLEPNKSVTVDYTNWRGERRERKIQPICVVFKRNRYHPEEQWILWAFDLEMEENIIKQFAMKNIHEWK